MSAVAIDDGAIRGFLHEAAGPDGLVLTHGAGGNCQMPLLVAVANAFAAAGITVLRYDLPFRQKRKSGAPSPSGAAADRAGLDAAAEFLRGHIKGKIFLGGQSYGGRQASMLLAEKAAVADGLLLLSYPLHPPGKPDRLRTQHLPDLRVPVLFVHGTKDPFGSIEELESARKLIPGRAGLSVVEGAGHDLKRGKFDISGLVLQPFLSLTR